MLAVALLCILLSPVGYILMKYVLHVLSLKNYPPGPFPWPVIGNLNLLKGRSVYEVFAELAAEYGDIFSLSLASERLVVVNTVELAREALINKGDVFSGRMLTHPLVSRATRGYRDLVFSEGKRWTLLRKLTHSSLKTYGYGMDRIEKLVVDESIHLHQSLREMKGKSVNPDEFLGLAFLNVIGTLLFGKRYKDHNDPEFQKIFLVQQLFAKIFDCRDVGIYMPALGHIFKLPSVELLKEIVKVRDPIFDGKVQEHLNAFNAENTADLTDYLIKFSKDMVAADADLSLILNNDSLAMIMQDFVTAGVDTGMSTIGFAIRYLIHSPDIQDRIFEELDKELGVGVYPSVNDRSRLHLLEATAYETLRLSSIVPRGIFHKTLEDTNLAGWKIKKGTVFSFNLWGIHHDGRHWDNPEKFDPYRWLNESGEFVPGSKISFMPFGAGRRNCVGESLAKAELFLFLGRLLVDFKFGMEKENDLPSLKPVHGAILRPHPCCMTFTPRHT